MLRDACSYDKIKSKAKRRPSVLRQVFTVLAAFLTTSAGATSATWEIDKAHSSVGFSVRHLVISDVKGTFGDYSATIEFDADKLEGGSVEFTVQVASIDTDEAKRDEHLRSADFFDVENFPAMTFRSKKVHDVSGENFKLTGDLTMRGITKEVTFDGTFRGVVTDPWGNTKAGFAVTAKINRQDFDVKWNKTLDAGGVVVGNEVTINIELELGMAK
ncbi:MAG: polyisoprenoid-binding protein [Candidatus Zixiibacteriota bacterium]|nr:MAG: polyisoprenoid-binding protein [candidate division Zixibacteria bacterium]